MAAEHELRLERSIELGAAELAAFDQDLAELPGHEPQPSYCGTVIL
jgi:hypothetical protein